MEASASSGMSAADTYEVMQQVSEAQGPKQLSWDELGASGDNDSWKVCSRTSASRPPHVHTSPAAMSAMAVCQTCCVAHPAAVAPHTPCGQIPCSSCEYNPPRPFAAV
jgi:hypothetical protein